MPRDEWAKARANDIARKAGWRPGERKARKKSRKRGRRHRKPIPKTDAWNQNTVLWFGKYNGQPLCEIPQSYLSWIVAHPTHSSWRIAELCNYLRTTYLPQTRSKTATPERDTSYIGGPSRSCHSVADYASSQTDQLPAESGGRSNPDAQAATSPLELAFQQLAKEPGDEPVGVSG